MNATASNHFGSVGVHGEVGAGAASEGKAAPAFPRTQPASIRRIFNAAQRARVTALIETIERRSADCTIAETAKALLAIHDAERAFCLSRRPVLRTEGMFFSTRRKGGAR